MLISEKKKKDLKGMILDFTLGKHKKQSKLKQDMQKKGNNKGQYKNKNRENWWNKKPGSLWKSIELVNL